MITSILILLSLIVATCIITIQAGRIKRLESTNARFKSLLKVKRQGLKHFNKLIKDKDKHIDELNEILDHADEENERLLEAYKNSYPAESKVTLYNIVAQQAETKIYPQFDEYLLKCKVDEFEKTYLAKDANIQRDI